MLLFNLWIDSKCNYLYSLCTADSDSRNIEEIRVRTANESDAGTIEELAVFFCVGHACCQTDIRGPSLEIGESFTISLKSLGECYMRKFTKYSDEISVRLKLTTSLASDPDGWLNKDVEIQFNNDEIFTCQNKDMWISKSEEKFKDEITLKCWKKVDKAELGKNETLSLEKLAFFEK